MKPISLRQEIEDTKQSLVEARNKIHVAFGYLAKIKDRLDGITSSEPKESIKDKEIVTCRKCYSLKIDNVAYAKTGINNCAWWCDGPHDWQSK